MKFTLSGEELDVRISTSLSSIIGNKDECVLLWKGFLTAGYDNNMMESEVWYHLIYPLPNIGDDEISEIYDGPMTPEEEELRKEDEYLRNGIISMPGPTLEENLSQRIKSHLLLSSGSHIVVCLWKGYLSCMYEVKRIDLSSFKQLMGLLPTGVEDQIMRKIFYFD